MDTPLSTPTSDERIMAGLSHIFGAIFALIVYITHHDKSKFVRFQSLQALVFDGVVLLFTLVLSAVIVVLFFILMGFVMYAIMTTTVNTYDPTGMSVFILVMSLLPILPMLLVFPLVITIMLFRIVAGIRSWHGIDFHYPVIGKLVEKWSSE